ncbi:Deoxyhypusine synthase [Hypsibius exemplaris]|uniref:deoxyhypusine synthase n=1 Tax=Hypsibius exemplaris TaxID=2072580 RepID=A0A1W0WQ98_HYPEX|nr:Deoxyhypusine synthase [Hypsibius exemplaris]
MAHVESYTAICRESPQEPIDGLGEPVRGYDFSDHAVDYRQLLSSFRTTGFQATVFSSAVEEINKMIASKLKPKPDESAPARSNCTIFLGYTSNMVSCGVRETIRFLVQHKMVDCIVTTAGGIEEDFMKCWAPTHVNSFDVAGAGLRAKQINRIGNLLIPTQNYCMLEDWIIPILDQMLLEQRNQGVVWTPSRLINRLGQEINNPDSIYYWAWKNDIPVFSPAITDGGIGDMLYFHSVSNPGLVLDIIQDVKAINVLAIEAVNSGMIILGGGLSKHHICNANLMRNGADFSVYVNTGHEFDGSDAGAQPDEAVSWGKIKVEATPVKVCADASLVFPLLVAETFAQIPRDSFCQLPRDSQSSGSGDH